jgi:hypothetical protein
VLGRAGCADRTGNQCIRPDPGVPLGRCSHKESNARRVNERRPPPPFNVSNWHSPSSPGLFSLFCASLAKLEKGTDTPVPYRSVALGSI